MNISKLDHFIQEAVVEQNIPGLAFGLVRDSEPILVQGYGMANLEHQIPVTADSVFAIASITKLFTATAVMQLIEKDLLTLTDPIGNFLPNLPQQWHSIQIHHILSHQSGIKSYTEVPAYWDSTRLDIPHDDILKLVADLPLQFEPGSRQAYDNTGYYLLGYLIEKLSRQAYGDYLQANIFAPLQMSQTQVNDPYKIIPNRAAGYTMEGRQLKNAAYYSPSGTYSGGVLLSSVNDLLKFNAALYGEKLLKKESQQLMWQPRPSAKNNEAQWNFQLGLGWFLVTGENGRKFIGHNGSMVGYCSSFTHFPSEKITTVALYNTDMITEPHKLLHEVVEMVLNEK